MALFHVGIKFNEVVCCYTDDEFFENELPTNTHWWEVEAESKKEAKKQVEKHLF